MNSISSWSVLNSENTTIDIAGKGRVRTHMCIDVTENLFTWEDIFLVHIATDSSFTGVL